MSLLLQKTAEMLNKINEDTMNIKKGEDVTALLYGTATMLKSYVESVAKTAGGDPAETKKIMADAFRNYLLKEETQAPAPE